MAFAEVNVNRVRLGFVGRHCGLLTIFRGCRPRLRRRMSVCHGERDSGCDPGCVRPCLVPSLGLPPGPRLRFGNRQRMHNWQQVRRFSRESLLSHCAITRASLLLIHFCEIHSGGQITPEVRTLCRYLTSDPGNRLFQKDAESK